MTRRFAGGFRAPVHRAGGLHMDETQISSELRRVVVVSLI